MSALKAPADGRIVSGSQVQAGDPSLEKAAQLQQAGEAWSAHVGLAPSEQGWHVAIKKDN